MPGVIISDPPQCILQSMFIVQYCGGLDIVAEAISLRGDNIFSMKNYNTPRNRINLISVS